MTAPSASPLSPIDAYPPVRWGILGAANIALRSVIPAMQQSSRTPVVAIASRSLEKADAAARELGVSRAYGSYDELLADPDVDAIYNPLPNHLHVPWTIRAVKAGKHVLCEKPIGLSADEVRELIAARDATGMQIAEAFMVRAHPQWTAVRELIAEDRIGDLRLVSAHFSYFKRDATDIRANPEFGGGALMDIGCYAVMIARWLFGQEPLDVAAVMDVDPEYDVDRLASAIMRFPSGQAVFSCAGQLVPYQKVQIMGTRGRIEIEVPFNAPAEQPTRIFLDDGKIVGGLMPEVVTLPAVNQYKLQGERFSEAVRGLGGLPCTLEDSFGNMAALDAIFRSADSQRIEHPDTL